MLFLPNYFKHIEKNQTIEKAHLLKGFSRC